MNLEPIFASTERASTDVFQRPTAGDIDLWVGATGGKRSLLFLTKTEPPSLPRFASLSLSKSRRDDGLWITLLTLERSDLKTVFTSISEDLARASYAQDSDSAAYSAFLARLRYWRDLLERGPAGVLSRERLMGLLGELMFLLEEAVPRMGAESALRAWKGPLREPKDFVFSDVELEVKACRSDDDTIEVSSLEQLTLDERRLFLVVFRVDQATAVTSEAISVQSIVDRASEVFGQAFLAGTFETMLRLSGFEPYPDYSQMYFLVSRPSFFLVSGTFPRLERSGVPPAVASAKYGLRLQAFSDFRVQDWGGPRER